MPNELTDDQIALLCDVGEFDLTKFTAEKRANLELLLSQGYITPAKGHPASAYELTEKGYEFLSMRGAGLNDG